MKQRTSIRTLQRALLDLRALISRGVEFPDAHFQTSHRYHLTAQQDRVVVERYDTPESGHERAPEGACTSSAATISKSHSERR